MTAPLYGSHVIDKSTSGHDIDKKPCEVSVCVRVCVCVGAGVVVCVCGGVGVCVCVCVCVCGVLLSFINLSFLSLSDPPLVASSCMTRLSRSRTTSLS